MKIAIPVEKKQWDVKVADVFGRSAYFAIYNTETKDRVFIQNTGAKAPNGAGIKSAQLLIDNEMDCVILPRIGKKGADLLEAANIKLYSQNDLTVEENIVALQKKELKALEEIHPGFHGGR